MPARRPTQDFAFRWGDYSGIGVDPTDGSIWSGAEYSTVAPLR